MLRSALSLGLGLLWATGCWVALAAEDAPAPPAVDAPKYKLEYKFQAEAVVRYHSQQNANIFAQHTENTDISSNKTETKKHYRVLEVRPDGAGEVELVIDWVRMRQKFDNDSEVEFDSAKPEAKTMKKFYSVLQTIGKPQAQVVCAPSGKVLEISVKQADGTRKKIEGKELAFLTILPETELAVGETWSEDFESLVTVEDNLKQTIKLKRVYKLEKVEGELAYITFKTAVLTPVKDPKVRVQLIQVETRGKLTFDMARGLVSHRVVDIDGTVIAPFGENTSFRSQSHLLELFTPPEAAETAEVVDVKTADNSEK